MTTMMQRLTPAERRQRNRQEMIQAILDVSREVMREEGVAALNLNEVARRLKMKTPSLSRIPHLAQTSDAVNRQLSCFSSRYMNLLAVFQI